MNLTVSVGRRGIDRGSVVAVARGGARVEVDDEAREALAVAAELVARASESTEPVYGVSTGFGSLATTVIPPGRREELQRALVRSHAAGMGPPVEAVRRPYFDRGYPVIDACVCNAGRCEAAPSSGAGGGAVR
jgi:histidine ammonia-lyase